MATSTFTGAAKGASFCSSFSLRGRRDGVFMGTTKNESFVKGFGGFGRGNGSAVRGKKTNVDESSKGGGKEGKKQKKMPGDEEEDEDEEEFEYEEVEVDEDGNEIIATGSSEGEEEEDLDASDLAPTKRSSTKEKKGVQQTVTKSIQRAYENEGIRNLSYVVGVFLAGTLGWSIYKVYRRSTSRRAVRKKTVNKNVLVIERLKPFFPNERESMTRNVAKGIARSTGFTTQEVFRKYLRYKMVEEPFTGAFVEDILALKNACELTPKQMSEILSESAARMVKKYGTLILDVSELTKSGAERKMIAAQMFSKLCYLADLPALVEDQEVAAETGQKLKELFGATDEDYARLRVDSLSESSDVSVLAKMSGFDKAKGGGAGGSSSEDENKDESSEAGGV
ncbi:unnamed protein product [Bathycoccus prasinos]|jgi:hypothetical protein|tara:strand:- start:2070 stop:3254 length:1185 start_codon:yes stop_codon:yes gene_type:complete